MTRTPSTRITTTPAFKIEILTADGWSDDTSLLGAGANQDANRWRSQAAAQAACADLVTVGFDPSRLRVAPAHDCNDL